ncbi:hypothetical protein I5G81_gp81 [Mycobacterium phage Shandong1]|uniref:Helix-turn-helix DNA binding domain protein n=1 Tax=Mycobacterium phage Shandong1 TaxID=1983447 RepID=A0A1X9SHL9_9CAUD|nr:hypothetical protein I5G81_gp81 [Mycobacterium phage Shandong1]ARQ95520.1 hypothetical protein [Mycobacterium phage Shandong1]
MNAQRTPREAAARFFRGWLAAGTAASILGNVVHALLDDGAGSPVVAAALAAVAPVALLGATHGVQKLVQSRIVGGAYTASLWITVAVASSAFALSFAALRELAIVWGGVAPAIAFLVPLVVDLSITGSTIALLALSNAERAEVADEVHAVAQPVHVDAQPVHTDAQPVAQPADLHVSEPADLRPAGTTVAELIAREAATSAHVDAHMPAAERIVAQGVTRIDRVKVAEVLAAHADGTAPSMIARKLQVGYTTVVRILDHHTAQADDDQVLDVEAVAS